MSEASKAPEPSSQPTKRGRKAWLIALAAVVAVVMIMLLANAPKPEPVKVWFVRATNEAGVKKLVFEGTNGGKTEFRVSADVVPVVVDHSNTTEIGPPAWDGFGVAMAPGTSVVFTLKAPPKAMSYYVTWSYYGELKATTGWARFRIACFNFFRAHGMPRLAWRFAPRAKFHTIPSTEIKE